MKYELKYFKDFNSSELEINYSFESLISKTRSKKKRNILEEELAEKTRLGKNRLDLSVCFLDIYMREVEKFTKKDFNTASSRYIDTTDKKRTARIDPYASHAGLYLTVKSKKILKPEDLFDYERLYDAILTGSFHY